MGHVFSGRHHARVATPFPRAPRRLRRAMSKTAFAGLKAVQEIRFHLCQTSKGSEGVRNFLLKSYQKMKAASPATPILIREASGVRGGMTARYGKSRAAVWPLVTAALKLFLALPY